MSSPAIPNPRRVLSLISPPQRPALDAALLTQAAALLPHAGTPLWLDEAGSAAEITFAGGADETAALTALRALLGERPVDVNVLPDTSRRKRLLVADMDSTMIEQECVDELADLLGLRAEVSAITERAMRGEIAFEPALRERVHLLKGMPLATIEGMIAQRITLMPGAKTLIATMRAAGAHTALVSGGFTLFTGPVGRAIGFDESHGNVLPHADGVLAGTVTEPILGREAKRDTLIALRDRLGLSRDETLAVGDGANDLAMIGEAGLGVAFRAKPAVAEAAAARIDHGDLTALLHLQGMARREFAS